MKITIEKSPDIKGITPWYRVRVGDDNGKFDYRTAVVSKGDPISVGYYTPKGLYYREEAFDDYETAWRFMWRKATGVK